MIIVTGGKGFIGANLVRELKKRGEKGIKILDTKDDSLNTIRDWLTKNAKKIDGIYHMGAITDTTIMDAQLFLEYNIKFSLFIWRLCTEHNIPLVYASSAATYGDGKEGFDDECDVRKFRPLNPYGKSKQLIDEITISEKEKPSFWCGLKFFNVYGFDESDKNKMASVVYHAYNQIKETGKVKLFKSFHPKYGDGEQKRDFIYVDDVVNVCINMMQNKPESSIYNVGTGKARTFNALASAVFKELKLEEKIEYIDIPTSLAEKYQYYTQAKTNKLEKTGCSVKFYELEEGISKYIKKLEHENC